MAILESGHDWRVRAVSLEWINALVTWRLKELTGASIRASGPARHAHALSRTYVEDDPVFGEHRVSELARESVVGPGSYCHPRQRMSFDSVDKGCQIHVDDVSKNIWQAVQCGAERGIGVGAAGAGVRDGAAVPGRRWHGGDVPGGRGQRGG